MKCGLRIHVALLILLVAGFHPVYASEDVYKLKIPALKMSDALDMLAEKTKRSLFYLTGNVPGVVTEPLDGSYTLPDALKILLKDTNLNAEVTKKGVIVVSLAPSQLEHEGIEMNQGNKKLSLFAVIGALLSTADTMTAAQADDRVGSLTLQEIVVTAQKREQSIQDVPIAIAAFNTSFLDDAGINDIRDLQLFVPGLTVISEQSPVQTNFNIRGVGTSGSNESLESSVGLYIDGVYRSRQSSALNNLVDIERVEILKGPQGTLFGKNTVSGAIQYLTVAPKMDEYDGYVEINAGNLDYLNVNGAINIPIIDGKVAARLSGGISDREGYVKNIVTGEKLNDIGRYALRGQLLIHPTEDVSIRIIADDQKMDEKCCSQNSVFEGPSEDFYRNTLGAILGRADQYNDDISTADFPSFVLIEESGLSAEVNWNLGDITLTSISAYRKYESYNTYDADQSSIDTFQNNQEAEQETISQEFRIAGNIGNRVNYIGGLYYFDQELDADRELPFGPAINAALGNPTNGTYLGGQAGCDAAGISAMCNDPVFMDGDVVSRTTLQTQTSYAVFGQADFSLTEKFIATVGLRYMDEEKELDANYLESRFNPAWGAITVFSPFIPDAVGEKFSDTAVTGTVKFTYHWNDRFMTYISYGRGYKSGGTNIDRIDESLPGISRFFDPETVDSYELGFKGDLLDGRLRVNGAVFQSTFEDFQANTFTGAGFVLSNAGEITSEGFELDVSYLATDWLTISSGMAYIDAVYDSFIGGNCILTPAGGSPDIGEPNFPTTCDDSGNRVSGTPEYSVYTTLLAQRTLNNGNSLYGRLDVSWRDETPIGPDNDPNKTLDSYTLTNLRLGLRFADDRYNLSLWAKNLFDEDYNKGPFNTTFRTGSLTDNHTEPRTFGITLNITM